MIKSTISKLISLRDVNPAGLADGDGFFWNASAHKFEAGPGGGGGGGGSAIDFVALSASTGVVITDGVPDTSIITFDLELTIPSNSSQTTTPTWVSVDEVDQTIIHVDSGLYLLQLGVSATIAAADVGAALLAYPRRVGNTSTLFFVSGITAGPDTDGSAHLLDDADSASFVQSFLVSFPSDVARQKMKIHLDVSNNTSGNGSADLVNLLLTKLS